MGAALDCRLGLIPFPKLNTALVGFTIFTCRSLYQLASGIATNSRCCNASHRHCLTIGCAWLCRFRWLVVTRLFASCPALSTHAWFFNYQRQSLRTACKSQLGTNLPDRYRPVKPLLELSLRPVDGNRTRAPCLASIDDTISPLRSVSSFGLFLNSRETNLPAQKPYR